MPFICSLQLSSVLYLQPQFKCVVLEVEWRSRNFKATPTREEAARLLTTSCCCSLLRPSVLCGRSFGDGWLIKRWSSMRPVLDHRRLAGQRDSTSAGLLLLMDGRASESHDIKKPVWIVVGTSQTSLEIYKVQIMRCWQTNQTTEELYWSTTNVFEDQQFFFCYLSRRRWGACSNNRVLNLPNVLTHFVPQRYFYCISDVQYLPIFFCFIIGSLFHCGVYFTFCSQ